MGCKAEIALKIPSPFVEQKLCALDEVAAV